MHTTKVDLLAKISSLCSFDCFGKFAMLKIVFHYLQAQGITGAANWPDKRNLLVLINL